MVYGFAKQSGGQVRIYSELGVGTTVCIYLPRHHGSVDDERTDAATISTLPRSGAGRDELGRGRRTTVRMLLTDILETLAIRPSRRATAWPA